MIDSHAHLSSSSLLPEAPLLIERALEKGITKIINICTDLLSLEGGLLLQQTHKGLYNTAATTPHDVEKEGESFLPIVKAHSASLVALGETGLDYFYAHAPKELQQRFLLHYLELATEVKKPLIFHCRDAFEDLFALCQNYEGAAVIHCFTGTLSEAKKALERNWMISFSGIVTFKKSISLQEVAKFVPLEKMLIETDSPYLAPQSQRGKRNEPAFLGETACMIASLKGISLDEVQKQTTLNAEQFFGI